jgi:hypothetical protein
MQDVSRGTRDEVENLRLGRDGSVAWDVARGQLRCSTWNIHPMGPYGLGDNAPTNRKRFWESMIFCGACQVHPG